MAAKQKPFVLLFWSRDPDGTQHYQGDSLQHLTPGINGPTALAGVNTKRCSSPAHSPLNVSCERPPFSGADAKTLALASLCHVLLNSNEFLFVD